MMKNNGNNILNNVFIIFFLKFSSEFLFFKRLISNKVEFNKLNTNNNKLLIRRMLLFRYFDK